MGPATGHADAVSRDTWLALAGISLPVPTIPRALVLFQSLLNRLLTYARSDLCSGYDYESIALRPLPLDSHSPAIRRVNTIQVATLRPQYSIIMPLPT